MDVDVSVVEASGWSASSSGVRLTSSLAQSSPPEESERGARTRVSVQTTQPTPPPRHLGWPQARALTPERSRSGGTGLQPTLATGICATQVRKLTPEVLSAGQRNHYVESVLLHGRLVPRGSREGNGRTRLRRDSHRPDKQGPDARRLVTDRDFVCRLVAQGINPVDETAESCMSTPVVSVRETTPVEECARIMEESQIRRGPSSMAAACAAASSLRPIREERVAEDHG